MLKKELNYREEFDVIFTVEGRNGLIFKEYEKKFDKRKYYRGHLVEDLWN